MVKFFLFLYLSFFVSLEVCAEDVKISNSAHDLRAVALFKKFKCPVCSGNSIYDSESQFARDLRAMIKDDISAGKSDKEIIDYLIYVYGDTISFEPRFAFKNLLLWVLPFLIFIFGILYIFRCFKRNV